MRRAAVLLLATQLCSLIDSGKYQDISVDEIKDHIDIGDLLPYLENRFGRDIDLSLLIPVTDLGAPEDEDMDAKAAKQCIQFQVQGSNRSSKAARELIDALQRRRNVVADEGTGIRIERTGLCFLLASVIGLVGSGECDDPTSHILSSYSELRRVVDAWPGLPRETRDAIVEMVE